MQIMQLQLVYIHITHRNDFFGLSLDKTDHVIQNQTISTVRFGVRRLILFRRNKGQEMSKRSS